MVIRKKKCRDCGNAITHNTVCCPYCGSVDPFGYYRNTDRIVTIGFAPIFPDICYHLTHYKPAAADIPVASDNPAH
ncbi:hypothetical protein, partial [Escherichia coli]|uniref:hypothetical protein n=1 Tax=Escherichia coli TaxID=562 RepID=UPI0021F3FB93|nr:hypothetical protein [Escherichia coli]